MKKLFVIILFSVWAHLLNAQGNFQITIPDSVTQAFDKQLSFYPQEKLYLQIDKPNYILGEKIWFRAHLVDAILHQQANASRYVYTELINPFDSVICRIKTRPDSLGLFHGYLPIEEDLPEGNYMLRSYTLFMKNMGEEYFFKKSIYIADPLSVELNTKADFSFDGNKQILSLQFTDKSGNHFIEPDELHITINNSTPKKLKFDKDTIARHILKIPENEKNRVSLLSMQYDGRIYKRYIQIPFPDNEFDVSFFAEGGHLLEGVNNVVTFKAVKSNGLSENVNVTITDNQGNIIGNGKTLHLGMGSFHLKPQGSNKYFAECINEQDITKRFELPAVTKIHCGITIKRAQNKIFASIRKSLDYNKTQPLYLLVHIRGTVLYNQQWDDSRENVIFNKDFFPSGISHFILYDSYKNIVSERLIFNYSEKDIAQIKFSTDKENYNARQQVISTVKITDLSQLPLSGNFSVSVTDDKDVKIDTCNNIITNLLLTSEIKGYIENPSYYLKQNNHAANYALDLLMTSQGWRRYPIPGIIKGKLEFPEYPLERSQQISGKVDGVFRSVKDGFISIIAMDDSIANAHIVQTDQTGYFELNDIEYPDKTRFIVQAKTKKGGTRVFLEIDKEWPYPSVNNGIFYKYLPLEVPSKEYINKADQKYVMENGMRIHNLSEIEITAKRIPKTTSMYYSAASSSQVISSEDIEQRNIFDIRSLLTQIPGLMVTGNEISVRGKGTPLLVIDDVPSEDYNIFTIDVRDIGNIFLIKDASSGVMFGQQGADGALVITTKRGISGGRTKNKNISEFFQPLGYQRPEEFYSPKYKAGEKNTNPDLRTTIFWKPNVKFTEKGEAYFEFYTADTPKIYSVVIEGISDYGHIIHKVAKIQRE